MHGGIAISSALEELPPKDRILETACDLFYREGINAVGVEAIAAGALTNKMTLYRHFRSKDDLIVAYVTRIADQGDAAWEQLDEQYRHAPEKRLNAWVDYVEDALSNRFQRGCALANAAVELPAGHPARDVIEAYKERKRKSLVQLFTAARYRQPQKLADEVFLLFEGARISLQCGGKIPATRVVSMLRDLLSHAPKKQRTSQGRPS
ncbi:MAG TPA: TetR/AcrR family transcriptional regulator [Hyphomicrobium sp.]|nr:TetR/AcrR family transcriptional regulator [Hyphomicrobium sp.]